MKVFAIMTVARQIDGEFILIKPEKAFKQASKADEYAKTVTKSYVEVIQTPHGGIQCSCERGIFELEVEE